MGIISTSPGVRARLHAASLTTAGLAARATRGRGMRRATLGLARIFGPGHSGVVRRPDGTLVGVRLDDTYWAPLVSDRFEYEPEVSASLDRQLDSSTYFVDCGANIGYWSVRAAKRALGVVAVEASPRLVAEVRSNSALNGVRVNVVEAAVWSVDDQALEFADWADQPQASGLSAVLPTAPELGVTRYQVTTRTLDRIIAEHCPDPSAPVVVKLDVEGAEIAAIEGAAGVLRSRPVSVIYEDHGGEASCAVTRGMLDRGLTVRDCMTGRGLELGEVRARKLDRARGYNFIATNRLWENR